MERREESLARREEASLLICRDSGANLSYGRLVRGFRGNEGTRQSPLTLKDRAGSSAVAVLEEPAKYVSLPLGLCLSYRR